MELGLVSRNLGCCCAACPAWGRALLQKRGAVPQLGELILPFNLVHRPP